MGIHDGLQAKVYLHICCVSLVFYIYLSAHWPNIGAVAQSCTENSPPARSALLLRSPPGFALFLYSWLESDFGGGFDRSILSCRFGSVMIEDRYQWSHGRFSI